MSKLNVVSAKVVKSSGVSMSGSGSFTMPDSIKVGIIATLKFLGFVFYGLKKVSGETTLPYAQTAYDGTPEMKKYIAENPTHFIAIPAFSTKSKEFLHISGSFDRDTQQNTKIQAMCEKDGEYRRLNFAFEEAPKKKTEEVEEDQW